jgi:hypothetical protein
MLSDSQAASTLSHSSTGFKTGCTCDAAGAVYEMSIWRPGGSHIDTHKTSLKQQHAIASRLMAAVARTCSSQQQLDLF